MSSCQDYFQTSYPNLTPTITALSFYNMSSSKKPTKLTVYGTNFTNTTNTTVNFGQYIGLPITFYTSTCITFYIPINTQPGTYNVQVVCNTLYTNIVVFTINQ